MKKFTFVILMALIPIFVLAQAEKTATFEDIILPSESHYAGSEDYNGFSSGNFFFYNSFMPEWYVWSGFAVSNHTTTTFNPDDYLTGQFYNVVGSGYNSPNYGVVYPYEGMSKIITTDNHLFTPNGVYVTNSAWAYDAMVNGDSYMGEPFQTGDWFKIVATGIDPQNNIITTEFYLADFRSADPEQHYILTEWTWFDLSPLNEISSLTFELDCTRKNAYGLTIPAYFCIDDFSSNNVGIKNHETTLALTVFPNPASDKVTISNFPSSALGSVVDVRVLDIYGKTIMSFNYVVNSNTLEICLSSLKPNVYFIKIDSFIQKIIKI